MSPVFGNMSTKRGYRHAFMISMMLIVVGSAAHVLATTSLHVFLAQVMLGEVSYSSSLGLAMSIIMVLTPFHLSYNLPGAKTCCHHR